MSSLFLYGRMKNQVPENCHHRQTAYWEAKNTSLMGASVADFWKALFLLHDQDHPFSIRWRTFLCAFGAELLKQIIAVFVFAGCIFCVSFSSEGTLFKNL